MVGSAGLVLRRALREAPGSPRRGSRRFRGSFQVTSNRPFRSSRGWITPTDGTCLRSRPCIPITILA